MTNAGKELNSGLSNSQSTAETFMPAEWLPHQRILTSWPNLPGAYYSQSSLLAARSEVASIANAISEFETVWLYATASEAAVARGMVNEKVLVKEADVDNLWTRDLGPVFVRRQGSSSIDAAIDFNFNYWGSKVEPTIDPTFARRVLAEDFKATSRHQAGIVSEGGALEIDGEGTLLVTDSSVINDNRNPGKSQDEIEAELKRLLGVTKVIWPKGVMGLESTDWHVDAFARFVEPGHIVLSQPPPNAHPDILDVYDSTVQIFKTASDAEGRKLKVTSCLEPDQEKLPGGAIDGMVTSYVNYLLVNNGVVLAKFGEPETDQKALEQMQSLFPERKISQVYINELPRLGGGIHCATQQVPI